MQLESISYAQHEKKPEEWGITDFSFGNINLIVGKNATGKSRTLSVIRALGNLVSGEIKLTFKSGNYKAIFNKEGDKLTYILKYEDKKVIEEKLFVGSDIKLDRGNGRIYAVEKKEFMKFQVPSSDLACVNRRDNVQHPFFENLYNWGKNLRHYLFGTQMGKDHYEIFLKDREEENLNLKDTSKMIAIFNKGKKEHPINFVDNVKADMANIGYDLDDIYTGLPLSATFEGPFEQLLQVILVKESDLKGKTDQFDMSQGMFRALSLIIQLNYSLLANIPSCILIDDIGEGLDYERSSSLIKLLIDKAKMSSVQLIMSTNDRFVMNNVPLEYWSVMRRFPNESKIYNYRNSRKKFEDFELTGLSNFDFLTSGPFGENQSIE